MNGEDIASRSPLTSHRSRFSVTPSLGAGRPPNSPNAPHYEDFARCPGGRLCAVYPAAKSTRSSGAAISRQPSALSSSRPDSCRHHAASAGFDPHPGLPARSPALQGNDQRPHAVRRPPPGHRAQPRRGGLDRGAAQELWLHQHRADQVRIHRPAAPSPRRHHPSSPPAPGRQCGRRQTREGIRRPAPGSTPIRCGSPTPPCAASTREPDRAGTAAKRCIAPRSAPRSPEEMYIVGAHMDGHGFGAAANDDGSGTALVMELARIFNAPDVETDGRSGLRCGTTKRPGSTAPAPTSPSDKNCRERKSRPGPGNIPSRNGSA